MSQADEETAKYKLNKNHYNYSHYGQMRKTKESKQQVMPLYENCTLNNNNDSPKPDHLLLERSPVKSLTFNYDYYFVSNTTNGGANINGFEACNINSLTPDYEYENINFKGKETLDKKILLQKYFRSALVGPRTNIYENLCRGCNYGVFNARGPLCTFCECIVNGVSALRSDSPETSLTTSNNIYENICEYCGIIYSGTNCSECNCQRNILENALAVNLGSEEVLLEKSTKQKKKVKINKSKSFSKTNKPRIFTNFWDTLRKPKNASSNSPPPKKPLEIIHHVEGYEEVFHTKDTFDLKKICELKRSATSCSDQHIYGRLKQNDLSCSQDEFNSTQSLGQSSNSLSVLNSKKPRISKAKFLRTTPSTSSINSDIKEELNRGTIYLNNSVCQWMTLLRHEIHAYHEDTLCYPKSIPSKSVLSACKAPTVTNQAKNLQNLTPKQIVNGCAELAEILKTQNKSMTLIDSGEIQETEEEEEEEEQQPTDCYQLMVKEFKANILNRQMLKTKTKLQHTDNIVELTMAGVNNNDSYTNNNNNNNNMTHTTDIPLRQAPSTAPANTMTANNQHNNKHKRQGMYLRLEDQQQLQPHNEQELIMNLHNNQVNNSGKKQQNNNSGSNNKNCKCKDQQALLQREREEPIENNREILNSEHKAVNTPETLLGQTKKQETLKRCLQASETEGNLDRIEKRRGIHERNVLEAFEALLEQERTNNLNSITNKDCKPINNCKPIIPETSLALQTFGDNCRTIMLPCPIQLLKQQQLAAGLNTLIICYDKYLKAYLFNIHTTTTITTTKRNTNTQAIVSKIPHKQLWRKFQQFYNYCEKYSNEHKVKPKTTTRETTCVSSKLKLELNVTNAGKYTQVREQNTSDSLISTANDLKAENFKSVEPKKYIEKPAKEIQKVKTPPQVPKRDPKTKLSPTTEIKRLPSHYKMTKPVNKLKMETKSSADQQEKELEEEEKEKEEEEEESIYQPIWKFETKGKVTECYRTEDDYYDLRALKQKIQQESPNSEIPKILISDEILPAEEEDHNNWEPDEEFVFTTQIKTERSSSLSSDRISTIRSTHSSNSSIDNSCSLSGSTITEFASSTATLASTVSSSLKHYLLRNIGIFYSLTEPKLRAIIYDYDRIHSFAYFNKPLQQTLNAAAGHISDSGFGRSLSPFQATKQRHNSNSSTSPSTSTKSSPVCALKKPTTNKFTNIKSLAVSESDKLNEGKAKVSCLIPSSVQAWKYQLLDVNCMEDEEDMIVSESEILRAQQVKEDIDQTTTTSTTATQPQLFAQRFKSLSTENFLDLPIEGDKKTITERLANMYTRFSPIQRGILNINGKNSPKSEKKAYKLNRASQATSLYLEDGLKPRYPIFGAPLDQLELQQNVPRFVVDAVDYIERKDRIIQDGIYRACGNKFSIDELKQKLTKSYIYDSKLINADDIHTVTSLLKQFFRDLPLPVIPKDIYSRITANLSDRQGIDTIRIAIEEMKEPNKSTLRFLIKHLTNVAACSCSNRMNASNVAIVWGPSLFAQNDTYDMIGRMNTLTKVLIENYDRIFDTNERLL